MTKRRSRLKQIPGSFKGIMVILFCALGIGGIWLLNFYTAATKQVVESSLGLYITPTVFILLAVFVIKEPFLLYKIIARALAAFEAVILNIHIGRLPIIALLPMLSLTTYTFLMKTKSLGSLVGIIFETLILLIAA